MPKIIINEEEKVSSAALDITENIVFVPVFTKNVDRQGKYKLYTSSADFEEDFKGTDAEYIVKLDDVYDKSFVLARVLLDTGLKVLAYGVEQNSDFGFEPEEEELADGFVSGTTTITNYETYIDNTLKLFNDTTEVTTFTKKTRIYNLTSAQSTSLQAAGGLSITDAVNSGETYVSSSIKFYSGDTEVTPATAGTVTISDTTLSISQTTFSTTTVVDKITIGTSGYDSVISLTVSKEDGKVSIIGFESGDEIGTVTKLTYNYAVDSVDQATSAMATAQSSFIGPVGNKNLYNVKFLTNGGYGMETNKQKALATAATDRGDCLALLDFDDKVKIANILPGDSGTPAAKSFEASKFAAAFFPWCTFEFSGDLIGVNKTSAYYDLPGSAAYLFAYGRSVQSNANWFAASGVTRGTVPGLIAPKEEITEGQMHILQGDKPGVNAYVNPIMMVGSYGYKIWGNRITLTSTNDSYFKFLNVRMLLCDIKKTLYLASLYNTFEPNDDITWINFKTMCSGTLDRMTSGRGLSWYRWKKELNAPKATIKATLIIRPIEAVETFELTVYLTEDETVISEEA